MAELTTPPPAEPALAAELRALGRALDVPPAPDLRAAVRGALADAGPARTVTAGSAGRAAIAFGARPWGRVAAALVALALLAGGTLAVSPRARAAVADFFRFGAVRVSSGAPPVTAPTAAGFGAAPPGSKVTTLDGARRAATFPVGVPAALGPPDQVVAHDGPEADYVGLRYGAGPGRPVAGTAGVAIQVDEFAGTIDPYADKYLSGGRAERVAVAGGTGVWIDGPHELIYADRSGNPRFESARMAGRTLIWQRGSVTYRLEGDLTLPAALAVAASVR